jgi:hypothetical protein
MSHEGKIKDAKTSGPQTAEGIAISSRNSTKHGILAGCVTKFDTLNIETVFNQLAEEFGVETPSRRILVEQLALTYLRLARCVRAETELINEALDPAIVKRHSILDPEDEVEIIHAGTPPLISHQDFAKFQLIYERYEPKLVNRFLRIMSELKRS